MPRTSTVILTEEESLALHLGYTSSSSSPIYSRRCHIVILKSKGLQSKEIGFLLGVTDQCVNNWVKRYRKEGLSGLQTKPGQGRRPILNEATDGEKVRLAVEKERQRLKFAKEELSQELKKDFSLLTLKRFLKNLATDGNASG